VRLGDQRAHVVRLGVGAGADLHLGDLGLQPGHQRVGPFVAHRDHQRHRHAALAAGAVGRAHQRADGVADVGVGHQHRMVLGATQRLHALAVRVPLA
jgi:hypothetical protein